MEGGCKILKTLQAAGYEAYFVGGCVRDLLLGRPVHDRDITTSALPKQVESLFPKTVPTGEKHGTVTVLEGGEACEVTTFRTDGAYEDSRHPTNVTFVPDLREDLARRDFTVNAMAMDDTGAVTDLFGGRADLDAKLLRCVGDPETRFSEDALRMLRAIRFSAQLGFAIEEKTYAAIVVCAPLAKKLSAERVRDELGKTLLSEKPEYAAELARLGLLAAVGITSVEGALSAALPCDRTVRWADFFRACPEADWERLRLDKKTGVTASRAAALAGTCKTRLDWKKLLSREGEAVGACCAALTDESDTVAEISASGECLHLSELAVSGADFPQLQGSAVGEKLQALLLHVLEHPEDNAREILLRI